MTLKRLWFSADHLLKISFLVYTEYEMSPQETCHKIVRFLRNEHLVNSPDFIEPGFYLLNL